MDRSRFLVVLAALLAAPVAAAAAATQETPAGDPAAGRALYVGTRAFSAGGPPCGACHGVGGEGLGLAARFGPDLSGTVEALGGPEALDAMLESLPFPSMEPLYAGRALTPAERADLTAFLVAAGGRAPAHEDGAVVLHAGLAFAALGLAIALTGRRRAGSARDRLVRHARARLDVHPTPGDRS
jgi:mono/diheme cytochrome c family protein